MTTAPDPRRWRALPVVLCACSLAFFDLFAVNVAAPSIQRDLHAGAATLQLVVAGYSFAYAIGLVTGGRLGDRLGRERLLLWGMAWFGLACAGGAAAPTAGALVAARVAQGVGAAAMVPQVLALIQALFPADERPRALAAFGVNAGLSTIAGQVLGGVLLDVDPLGLGWRAVFALQVPLALGAVVLGRRLVPGSRAARPASLDPAGTATLAAALALLLVPLTLGPEAGWPTWTAVALVAAGPTLAAFALSQRRLARRSGAPILDPRLLGAAAFPAGLVVTVAFYAELGSFFLVVALYLQDGLGLSPLAAGLTFAPLGVGFAVSSLVARRLAAAVGGATVLGCGIGIVTATLAVTTAALAVDPSAVGTASMAPVMALVGIGNGLALPTLLGVILGRVPIALAGAAAGVLTTAQQAGTVLGVAGVGTIYFGTLRGGDVPGAACRALAADGALAALTLVLVAGLGRRTRRAATERRAAVRPS